MKLEKVYTPSNINSCIDDTAERSNPLPSIQNEKLKAILKILLVVFFSVSMLFSLRYINLTQLVSFLQQYRSWAFFISIGLNVLISVSGLLPSVFLSGANALVFGLFWGGVVSWLGEVTGAVLSFLFYRYFVDSSLHVLAEQTTPYRFLQNFTPANGFKAVMVARLLPLIPSGLVNLLAALTRIPLTTFVAATALGKIPSLVFETFVGHDLLLWQTYWPRLLVLLFLSALVYIAFRYISQKY
ncbi:TVP38/TMEM64 family protein [Thermanaerosceptrum fracticalcis]|uniref:TVP38/TMEM64 family membrane protein n=1 Tax=Thermanaerosceptrum fracticalcis TaxID=1712410 RepID=A0A7G6E2F1_THEFR|nr:TVP38/TMEM64 family protein [Thermanaerosceptrum fracticalcis]